MYVTHFWLPGAFGASIPTYGVLASKIRDGASFFFSVKERPALIWRGLQPLAAFQGRETMCNMSKCAHHILQP